ncbi:MAG: histidine phosphatase family protein [Propionibacteriaceae bacterium]|jgi:broad specificity phosphatase PhoE|nr:histidine phosphatase family protein [Propionibacteriaceae bacterium]
MSTAVVHCVRHGQVDNPSGVIYGRLPGFGLTDLGHQMAQRLGVHFAAKNLVYLVSSPLQRAQETMAPIAAGHPELEVQLDERVIETENHFEGINFGKHNEYLLRPSSLWQLRNPLIPSWGEPYSSIVVRMNDAIKDAARHCPNAEAVIVSHELPIFVARRNAEGLSFLHDPRKRNTRLASVTSFFFVSGQLADIAYSEPAGDLVPVKKGRKFRAGS